MKIFFALVALIATPLVAQAEGLWVSVENNSGVTIREFYASNRDQRIWGSDWLGSQLLYSGQTISLNIGDGVENCVYDLKVVFMDGQEHKSMGFNVCEQASWSVN